MGRNKMSYDKDQSYILSLVKNHNLKYIDDFYWKDLNKVEKQILEFIGYTKDIWNNNESPLLYENEYDWNWDAIPDTHKIAWTSLGYNQYFEYVGNDSDNYENQVNCHPSCKTCIGGDTKNDCLICSNKDHVVIEQYDDGSGYCCNETEIKSGEIKINEGTYQGEYKCNDI